MKKKLQKILLLAGLATAIGANAQPDLAIGNISAGYSYDEITRKITGVYFDVLNNENDACDDAFEVALYLVDPDDYNVSHKIWSYIDQNGQGANSVVTYDEIDVDLNTVSPAVPHGCWRLAATVDWDKEIDETNENNNSVFISSQGNDLCYKPNGGETGIKEDVNMASIKVYPNPVAHLVTFSNVKSNVITITDVSGRIIESIVVETENKSLNMTNYQSGIYFYQVKAENKVLFSGKLIKE